MSETIHAAHNLTIQLDSTAWRLFNGTRSPDHEVTALLEAVPDAIRCTPTFAQARQLPNNGQLTPADVARVVVGWAPEVQSWHLGLMLAALPSTNFQTRWCGLASWPSGQAGEYRELARYAGQSLARLIDRPFYLIPPAEPVRVEIEETQPLQATARIDAVALPLTVEKAVEPIPLQAPPFDFDEWTMTAAPRGFIWQRRGRGLLMSAARVIGFIVLAVLFLLLGIGSQTRGLAAVNPTWLPWLGIAVAAILGGMALLNVAALLSTSDVIIDLSRREVRRQSRLVGTAYWRVPFDTAAYVLISQTPAQPQGRPSPDEPVRTEQAVWIHLYDGRRFWPIVALENVEGRCRDWDNARHALKTSGRRPLVLAHYDTPAHHAAQVMAQALGVDLWLDVRS